MHGTQLRPLFLDRKEHRDINMVMLATSLAPDAYLII